MTDRDLLKQALEALEWCLGGEPCGGEDAVRALRERLAHCDRCGKKLGGPDHIHTCSPQTQEPVAWDVINPAGEVVATEKDAIHGWARLGGFKPTVEGLMGFHDQGWRVVPSTAPPRREWVGLTEEERDSFWRADQMTGEEWRDLFDAIEAKLRKKNMGDTKDSK